MRQFRERRSSGRHEPEELTDMKTHPPEAIHDLQPIVHIKKRKRKVARRDKSGPPPPFPKIEEPKDDVAKPEKAEGLSQA